MHWAAYACWPVALLHGLGTGSDVRAGWLIWLALGCCAVVVAAVGVRIADRATAPASAPARSRRCSSGSRPCVWLPSGPLATGWAAKAGTPLAAGRRAHHHDRGRHDRSSARGPRPDGPISLGAPPRRHGPLPDAGPELIDEVERAGLRGRGGAGFPAAIKLAPVAAGSRPVVVVNGTEGEPMSAKDRSC